MRSIFLTIFCALPVILLAQDKSRYDVQFQGLAKSTSSPGLYSTDYAMTGSNFVEISLSNQGYFTIGTLAGASDSKLDDDCQITFGHPFAMTSYPVFSLDGNWHNFADYFTQTDSLHLYQEAGTLMFTGNEKNGLQIDFNLVAKTERAAVEFIFGVTNTDSVAHFVSPGFIMDPALGKWGDGIFKLGNKTCSRDSVITAGSLADPIQIWEKGTGAKGICSEIIFTTGNPEKIILANWQDVYNNPTPVFEPSELREIYDLVVKLYWSSVELTPGARHELRWELALPDPDFSSKVFTRWDAPSFLSLDAGLVFPGKMKTTCELWNTSNQQILNGKLNLTLPKSVTSSSNIYNMNIDAGDCFYQAIYMDASIIYEDRIVDITADILENDLLLESINRKLFIPATPVSDTGLVIVNDSVSTTNFPNVDIIFSAEVEATGQRILKLGEENLFLSENDTRIENFSFEKYDDDGVSQADIIFVLDVTGSMGDEIDGVKSNLVEFTDSLSRRGVDFRLGMVTFLDIIENVYNFTSDVQVFQSYINIQYAHGGGDSPENSLDALMTAAQSFEFRPAASRIIIWITDNTFHEQNNVTSFTAENVVNKLLENAVIVHCIGSTQYLSSAYNKIIIPVGGNFYDIYGNFRDILIEMTRFKIQDRYKLSFISNTAANQGMQIKIELHYAGLGVIKTFNIAGETSAQALSQLICYPNPFNPEITLQISKPTDLTGDVSIFNILGQRIRKFDIPRKEIHQIIWYGRNDLGNQVGSGFYIVQLTLSDAEGKKYRESTRILYLK